MSKTIKRTVALLPAAFAIWGAAYGATDKAEQAAAALVQRMTLEEKAAQLVSISPAIPRLGVPANEWWTEALHGVQGKVDTTNFPAPIGLAATFDDRLIRNVGAAISEEVRAVHANTRVAGEVGVLGEGGALNVWAPNVNIFRDPRWGRGQETYGEDPFLTGRIGIAFVQGIQGSDLASPLVIATPKHFAVHSGPETTRRTVDVKVSLHDLEDTYLPGFRATIVEGHAGSIMCSYNGVNGQPACANDYLLKTKLRSDWRFSGYVVSDCGAVAYLETKHKYARDAASAVAAAVKAGVDLECIPPNQPDRAKRYIDAVARGLLTKGDVDRAVTRLMAARIRVGDIAPDGHAIVTKTAQVLTEGHRALARETAEKSIVLLKNNGLLPLRERKLTILVTGPLADSVRVLRSNYSSPNVPAPVSVLAGIKAQFPEATIRYVPTGPSFADGDPIPISALVTAEGTAGLTAQYFQMKMADPAHPEKAMMASGGPTYEAAPFKSAVVDRVGQDVSTAHENYRAVYEGFLVAPETGTYRIGLKGMFAKLTFDGKELAKLEGYPPPQLGDLETVHLEKGHRYPLQVVATKSLIISAQLVWARISDDPQTALRDAAQNADVIVAAVGLNADVESEESNLVAPGFSHGDRTTLDLPADQQALLQAAKATGRKLVVVNLSGSAVNLSWARENADAVLQAWYPGEEGGTAVSRILSGKVNPSGRLPVTFYRDVASLPPFDDYSMRGRTYRYFTGAPLYPFGYGLSYTTFRYGDVVGSGGSPETGITIRTSVTNSGSAEGDEVAQLYLNFPNVPGVPNIALRGFQRVHLAPGESKAIEFKLNSRDLSSVSAAGDPRVLAGRYRVSVGGGQPGTHAPGSSADLQIDREVQVAK